MYPPTRPEFTISLTPGAVASLALDESLAVMETRLGTAQLADWSTEPPLEIVAQRGFGEDFLACFRRVSRLDPCSCGRALLRRAAVVVNDVMEDADYAPYRAVALRAGFRSVQSTPLMSTGGTLVGVLSTHDREPGQPSDAQMDELHRIARGAANAIVGLYAGVNPG